MRVLIIGGGGREHALAWRLAKSPRVREVFCAPGNAGTAQLGRNLALKPSDHAGLLAAVEELGIELTVVGPEAPLCAGLVDRFRAGGHRVFGPTAAAARIEGDKAYSKRLMKIAGVPTAEARILDSFEAAKEYIASREGSLVVKAAGLAAGKGVAVCADPDEALAAASKMMEEGAFGNAGKTILVEERLKGEEVSVFALVSGRTLYMFETAQDYKRAGDGDDGPNTGGMGAYSPAPSATPELMAKLERDVFVPIVDALRNDDAAFQGLLYAGIMITPGGPKVLEFNCRFGDPECQVLMMRLESDLLAAIEAVVDDRLDELEVRWSPKPAVCVIMASKGYPDSFETGKVIQGLGPVAPQADVVVFHSATSMVEHLTVSSGGRVLSVTGLGTDFREARRRTYAAVDTIHFENAYFRRDIAERLS